MKKTEGGRLNILDQEINMLDRGHQRDVEVLGDDPAAAIKRRHLNLIATVELYEDFLEQQPDNEKYKKTLAQAKTDLAEFEKKLKKLLKHKWQNLVTTIKSLEDLIEAEVKQDPENDGNKEALAQAKADLTKLETELKQLK